MSDTNDTPFEDPDDTFGEPATDDWVDVRMSDPDAGEWDVDVVVLDGRVEYVDLRIRPELLAAFVDCLVDDVGETRAEDVVEEVVRRQGLSLDTGADDGADAGE